MKMISFAKIVTTSVLLLVTISTSLFAQLKVGDNPATINPGSVLELESSNKGVLLPRVALTATTTWGLSGTQSAGMVVYNTSNAGNGLTAVTANTIYMWNGTLWQRLAKGADNNTNPATTPFTIGEMRSARMVVPFNVWTSQSGSVNFMQGKLSTDISTINKTPAFPNATNSPVAVIINGLRLDFIHALAADNAAPKLYNTTSGNITYTISSLSTSSAYKEGANTVIAPNAYSYKVEGNDNLTISSAASGGANEFVTAMISFPNGEWYNCKWHASTDGTNVFLYVEAQRLN